MGKGGTFRGLWNIAHNLGGAGAAGVALFSANYRVDGHVIGMLIFSSINSLVVGLIGLLFGCGDPESYGLGNGMDMFVTET